MKIVSNKARNFGEAQQYIPVMVGWRPGLMTEAQAEVCVARAARQPEDVPLRYRVVSKFALWLAKLLRCPDAS